MWWKVCLFVAVVGLSYMTMASFDAALHPTISADLAVGQLQDTESGAIALRVYDRFQNVISLGVAVSLFGFWYLLFRADVRRYVSIPSPENN